VHHGNRRSGICLSAIFSITNAVLLRPHNFPELNRLVVLRERVQTQAGEQNRLTSGDVADLARLPNLFQGVTAYQHLSDPDVGHDSRMMVPVFCDLGRKKTKVWAFLGWDFTRLAASFAREPKIELRDKSGKECTRPIRFTRDFHAAAKPVIHEILCQRDHGSHAVQAHCDKYRTAAGLLENLP
jgi:hypothetical protein